nr:prepilin-type N-terminal cleavage/methylation domain-containing protein [uncultured Butyrivibrio sp.]
MANLTTIIKKKLHSKAGFSLTELLATVIILLLVSSIVATGIPVARDAYEKVVIASNAEILLSSTITTLRNELGTAKDVEISSNEITYYNPSRSALAKIYVDSGTKDIMFVRYLSDGSGQWYNEGTAPTLLMSTKTATKELYITYTSVTYSDGVVTFDNLSAKKESDQTELAKREHVSIRVIAD